LEDADGHCGFGLHQMSLFTVQRVMGQQSRFYTTSVWRSVYPLSGKQCSDFKFGLQHPSQRCGWSTTQRRSSQIRSTAVSRSIVDYMFPVITNAPRISPVAAGQSQRSFGGTTFEIWRGSITAAQQHRPTGRADLPVRHFSTGAYRRERAGFMNMKPLLIFAVTLLCTCISHAQRKPNKSVPPALEPQLKKFFVEKRVPAKALAKEENKEQMREVWDFFAAGEKGDWTTVANLYPQLRSGAYQRDGTRKEPRLETMVWQPVKECFFGYEQCANFSDRYVTDLAREILDSMPRGSIYFGGKASPLDLPTAFSQSHPKGEPAFVLSQNALVDGLYLKYLRTMYGQRIVMPGDEDSKKAFLAYTNDALLRLKEGKLKPGEDVTEDGGKVNISGHVSVMAINALMAKTIFDANPRQEFFVAESFPLDWMYPHLEPHGLILKLNRQPLEKMPEDMVQKDSEYWTRFIKGALGQWLTPTTSVEVVCDFAQSVFARQEQEPFRPDEKFVRNSDACKTYSRLRSAQAGVYVWRVQHSKSPEEKQRMEKAADLALRQAFALCPSSAEVLFRYVGVLVDQKRFQDARRLTEVTQILDPTGGTYHQLHEELNKLEANANKGK
jgi:hypothetical protein